MRIEFKETKMLIANVNVRSEVKGDGREPAGDIKLKAQVPSSWLGSLSPELKPFLFCVDPSKSDMADAAGTELPHLKHPQLEYPLKWLNDEMAGAKITIKPIGKNFVISLDPVKVNNLSIEPLEGGTVQLSLRVQAHPEEKEFGRLCTLDQHEVEVTLEMPGGN